MSKKLTNEEVREMFVDRWWEDIATPADYGPEFDEWLESVKEEAYDRGKFHGGGERAGAWDRGYQAGAKETVTTEESYSHFPSDQEATISTSTQDDIVRVTKELGEFLVDKNKAYGDSALDPVRIFSKVSPKEQLLVRLDDKLSRLVKGHEFPGDDDILDFAGYLILLMIAREREPEQQPS